MKLITRYCLKKNQAILHLKTQHQDTLVARKGKTDQKCIKYYPTAPTFHKSTGNHFYFMQCVSVIMPGVPLEKIFTGFQKNTVYHMSRVQLVVEKIMVLWQYHLKLHCMEDSPPPPSPSQEFATKLKFSATECLGLALHYK